MTDRTISATFVTALLCWLAGLGLIVLNMIFGWTTGQLGLFVAGAGGVLTMRSYLLNLEEREMAAFDLGRGMRDLRGVPHE